MRSPLPRVVVTGIGVVTSLGLNEKDLWSHLLAGKTGIQRLQAFDTAGHKTSIASEVDNDALNSAMEASGIRPFDRAVDMALLASEQALDQAGLIAGDPPYEPKNVAAIFGSGVGSAASLFVANRGFFEKGLRGLRPTSVPRCMTNAASAQISIRFKLTGPNYMIVSACTSSTSAIGAAFRMIRHGYIDQALCGGTDAFLDPFVFGCWNNLGVMSKNSDPEKACRPFDADRDGCVLGEGAGALLLESLESAQRRQARIRAEVRGYGESSDAGHITTPSVEGQARAIRAALECAGIPPAEVGFINAHGTATRANDACESRSIRAAMGEAADNIPVASNKSFFGHHLGASGAVESIVTILGLEAGIVPANLNLDNPDPECDINLVGSDPQEIAAPVAMKNSFGFGGNNAVLILGRFDNAAG